MRKQKDKSSKKFRASMKRVGEWLKNNRVMPLTIIIGIALIRCSIISTYLKLKYMLTYFI